MTGDKAMLKASTLKAVSAILLFAALQAGNLSAATLDGRHDVRSNDGRFTVSFPGIPNETQVEVSTAVGTLTMHSFIYSDGESEFGVMYSDYPAFAISLADKQDVLEGVRDGGIKSANVTLVDEKIGSVNGHPARLVTFEIPAQNRVIRALYILAGNRLYQILAITPNGDQDSPVAMQFLNSFEITGLPLASAEN
jgi:hypothetical protein